MLYNAQQLSINQQQLNDEPAYEYNNILRLGIFEAYSGIFNGLSPQKCQQFLQSSAKVRHSCAAPASAHPAISSGSKTMQMNRVPTTCA